MKENELDESLWCDYIPGFYQAHPGGFVRSVDRLINNRVVKGVRLKGTEDRYGYLLVLIYIRGIRKTKKVHRIVAETFFGESDLTVDHIDCNKQNNEITNLRYMTAEANQRLGNAKIGLAEACEIKYLIERGYGNAEIGKLYGVKGGTIYSIRVGKSWVDAISKICEKEPPISIEEREDVMELLAKGFKCSEVASSYNVSLQVILSIRKRYK